jgi:hypothetical protein
MLLEHRDLGKVLAVSGWERHFQVSGLGCRCGYGNRFGFGNRALNLYLYLNLNA